MTRVEQNDWLETFVAVAEHGSFSAAALAIHRSQSRVSAHVAALEQALGVPLFDRRHRPVELTDAGETFLPYARKALLSLDLGAAEIDALTGVHRGRVVLGSHPSISAGFLPRVLRNFSATHPQVRVELSEDTTTALAHDLAVGKLHLAIRSTTARPAPPGLVSQPLWREPYVAVVPTSHRLARAPLPLPPEALSRLPLIVIARPGAGLDPDTAGVLAAWNLIPDVAWQTEQPQTLANLAKEGLGVGVINRFAMEVSDTTGLAVLQVGHVMEGREVGLWHDPDRYMSSATRALHGALLDAPRPGGTVPINPLPARDAHGRREQGTPNEGSG
ncbi:LysR family transcriptional regulator [Kocuria aegyptia]|uniref:LysR family transcriptional regulator n=1 Tax=Kocuria aegyptia TaxID=330943 RepID=A0ABN2KU48_9MICC